eukprot:TRINITY_DN2817_c0_g1_i9.p1 TRINITY_DN2817_c0_g1~~TRINITY_DN2817_c0_g1_i9.p1  ORF type:complete len:577 (-),score=96.43 TRINITY_DN2817_c0_g1_i9:142-1872(-)
MNEESEQCVFVVQFRGETHRVALEPAACVWHLKRELFSLTGVEPDKQKLAGLPPKTGDDAVLASLKLKRPHKLLLFGLPPEEINEQIAREEQAKEDNAELRAQMEAHAEKERQQEEQKQEEARLREESLKRSRDVARQRELERRLALRNMYDSQGLWRPQPARAAQSSFSPPAVENPDYNASLSFALKCFSPIMDQETARPNLEANNKIICPQDVLEKIVSSRMPFPVTFKMTAAPGGGSCTHVGVLEFTAPPGVAYIPFWIMNKLELEEGAVVNFETARLPLGTGAVLQPHTPNWDKLPDTRSILEEHLRSHQALTVGDTILIPHRGAIFELSVVTVSCESGADVPAIAVADRDISVTVLPCSALRSSGGPGRTAVVHHNLQWDVPEEATVEADEYRFFTFVVDDVLSCRVQVAASPVTGSDPDVYVSRDVECPTHVNFTWSAQDAGAVRVTLEQPDPDYVSGRYFVGVRSYGHAGTFAVTVTRLPVSFAEEEAGGHMLSGQQASDGVICDNWCASQAGNFGMSHFYQYSQQAACTCCKRCDAPCELPPLLCPMRRLRVRYAACAAREAPCAAAH